MLTETVPQGYDLRMMKFGPYSPSRLIAAKCPQRFYGQYVRQDQVVSHTLAASRGSAIHEVLSKITMRTIAGKAIMPSEVDLWVSEAVGKFPAAYQQSDMIHGAAAAYIAKPSPYMNKDTLCEQAYAVSLCIEESLLDDVVPNQTFVATSYVDEDGKPNKAAYFGGRLDQINFDHDASIITIVDHKSTPNAAKNEDHNFQVGAYAWLVSQFYPGWKIRTVIHYAHPDLAFYSTPTYWDQDDLKDIGEYIRTRIASIEHFEDFPAIPGSACDYCHMVQACPENLKLMEQRARGSVDLNVNVFSDLERVAKQLRTVGALYDELNKSLKQGIEKLAPQGGVAIEGMWYGFKVGEESVDWKLTDIKVSELSDAAKTKLSDGRFESEQDKAKLELMAKLGSLQDVLVHYKIEPNKFKEWHKDKLKQLWKLDRPELMEMLKSYIVKDRSTRFGGYKR